MAAKPSIYLPDDFEARPIGLIAGKGHYPAIIAERIRQAGLPLRLISFYGETSEELGASLPPEHQRQVKVGQLGKLLKSLKQMKCGYALMAGQLTPKRLFHGLHPDLKALKILNSLKLVNAETVFGAIATEISALGIEVLDARSFLDDQLASEGMMTLGRLKVRGDDVRHGIRIAKGISDLDIGQGCVVRKGTVLAVEAYEGTDRMLERAGTFKTDGLIFVKTVKRNQDYRFDVPVFGERTLDVMHQSGIRTAALEVERVIMLEKERLLAKAKKLKIELVGFSDGQMGHY